MTDAPIADADLRPFHYAPGTYECPCWECGGAFIGDKDARTCRTCAEKLFRAESMKKDA